MFQYISCCYLSRISRKASERGLVSIHLMLLFIIFVLPCDMQEKGFNTSHVVIYQKFTAGLDTSYSGFNTSHVVIYRRSVFPNRTNIFQFQYISCCYLSNFCFLCFFCRLVSIHLMLLFIKPFFSTAKRLFQISIHLMLLFIFIASALSHLGF